MHSFKENQHLKDFYLNSFEIQSTYPDETMILLTPLKVAKVLTVIVFLQKI